MRSKTFTVMVGWLIAVVTAYAQPAPSPANYFTEKDPIKFEPRAERDRDKLASLVRGNPEAFNNPKRKELMETNARWLVFRLTDRDLQEGRDGTMDQHMAENVFGESKVFPGIPVLKEPISADQKDQWDRQRIYVAEMAEVMLPHLKRVLKSDRPIVRVNAARILARFLEEEQALNAHKPTAGKLEPVVDELLAIIENPQEHDAVRVWAFLGLAPAYRAPRLPDSSYAIYFSAVRDPQRIERAVMAIYRWLEPKCQMTTEEQSVLLPEELDGIRYVRRAAIRALGALGRPLVTDQDPRTPRERREFPTAQLLMQIMNNDKITPEPWWSERLEAAWGLCAMKHKTVPADKPAYQTQFVAHQVGQFIANMAGESVQSESKDKQRWPVFAARMRIALDDLGKDLAGTPAADSLSKLRALTDPLLERVFEQKPLSAAELNQWLANQTNQPPAKTVFVPVVRRAPK